MIYIRKAGLQNDLDKAYIASSHRVKSLNSTVYHNNDYSTEYRIPDLFFKDNFKYDSKTGIYKTNLKNADIKQFATVIKH